MENFENENSALHRKLQSKNEALKIMRTELERFRTERDQFKLMAETIQMRYSAVKNSLESSSSDLEIEGTSTTLGILLNQSREKNLSLQTETENLRQKLHELQGDVKLLRAKNLETSKKLKAKSSKKENDSDDVLKVWNEEKSNLIDQLEGLKKKNAHLQFDFRSLLDEKEEIVSQRDAFKCKAHRLNHELSIALKGKDSVDVDGLILENKFLHEHIDNLQKELEIERIAKQSNEKIQSMMKAKRVKGAVKFGSKELIMSHKQVTQLLTDTSNAEFNKASTKDLKALCLALLDNLNDKSVALAHQKQTNRLLGAKIGTLEQKIIKFSGESSVLTPSQLLLDNYASAKVDEEQRLTKSSRNWETSEINKSRVSSEYETQSTSDLSFELKQLNYIKIINDEDDEFYDTSDSATHLSDLPPDIQKLVDEAMKSSEISEIY